MQELFQEGLAFFREVPDIFYYLVIGGAIFLLGWWLLSTLDPFK
jgi:hypothetical protein